MAKDYYLGNRPPIIGCFTVLSNDIIIHPTSDACEILARVTPQKSHHAAHTSRGDA